MLGVGGPRDSICEGNKEHLGGRRKCVMEDRVKRASRR